MILTTLDPRAPLVLDTRELGRRPGSQRSWSLEAPAPAELGIDVLRVPEGSLLALHLRLEAVMEGVLVTGEVSAALEGECARCLEALHDDVEADFCELFVYDDEPAGAEDDDTSRLDGDLLDLEPVVRDAIVLTLPFQPLCRDDCPGLCAECGALLANDPGHAHDAPVDPRWAGLAAVQTDAATTRPDQPAEE